MFKIIIRHRSRPPLSVEGEIEYISRSAFQKIKDTNSYYRWIYDSVNKKWDSPRIISEYLYHRSIKVLKQNLNSN